MRSFVTILCLALIPSASALCGPPPGAACAQKAMAAGSTKVVRVEDFPAGVRSLLSKAFRETWRGCDVSGIADPGQPYNANQAVRCGRPMRQMIGGGFTPDAAYITYIRGGVRSMAFVMVCRRGRTGWRLCFKGRLPGPGSAPPNHLKALLDSGKLKNLLDRKG